MAMYAIAITSIHHLEDKHTKQVWFATIPKDRAHLRTGGDTSQIWDLSMDTNQMHQIQTGHRSSHHYRREKIALGTHGFVDAFVQRMVAGLVHEMERLSSIAITQLQAASAALTHGLIHKWTYSTWLGLSQTSQTCSHMMEVFNCCICQCIIVVKF